MRIPEPSKSEPGNPDHELFDLEAFRANGLLWALNRMVLHPRGLALALFYPEGDGVCGVDRMPTGWTIVRAEDGIWGYGEELDKAGQEKFEAFLAYVAARP